MNLSAQNELQEYLKSQLSSVERQDCFSLEAAVQKRNSEALSEEKRSGRLARSYAVLSTAGLALLQIWKLR